MHTQTKKKKEKIWRVVGRAFAQLKASGYCPKANPGGDRKGLKSAF